MAGFSLFVEPCGMGTCVWGCGDYGVEIWVVPENPFEVGVYERGASDLAGRYLGL